MHRQDLSHVSGKERSQKDIEIMSKEGIETAAQVFVALQENRIRLLGMKDEHGEIDKQNIVLGQMLGDMNDAFKNKFMKIVDGKLYGEGS